ncbi:C-terminal domain of CHU protein family protein [Belliella buryatensis]|uniref:C-terminal domain of CHU protein family protein n=1 Tax=Belliella buryatensis TaxID=1500549 RepID=A0A239GUB1_9BACT|nr:gliding motility-associated C-terminal domain-containing protein [Belliella buryatensis]SNS72707.1 C-terminal domain of CHU protein family protein [Belliella buryatensis]
MKSPFKSIKFISIFALFCVLTCVLAVNKSFSQGVNNNEWIFGYCNDDNIKRVVSFGRGAEPSIRDVSGAYNSNNSAVAVDPITGNVIFYTDGEFIYNGNNDIMIGVGNGINGNSDGRQQIAISTLDYDPNGNRLFYTFYVSPSGQLQYAVVDMNSLGDGGTGLPLNQPPLGEVIVPNTSIGPAAGAIAVVKSAQSPSYLINFSGGNLISRRIEDTQGDFTQIDELNIPFIPKAIIFNEATGQLLLIPENSNEDLILIDYDTATGSFGAITAISQSGGDDAIEGAAFSPDGEFIYFSKGNELLRVPTDDLGAEPEIVPLENDIYRIYDIKVGPDGRLYYIYEEEDGGPQFIGRVDNPDEEELEELELNEDPFGGVDFCGRVFPQFAPNTDVEAEVDFTWQPEEPCSNNPLQLTSSIIPQNYRPVSFEWTFEPELTDEDGEPLDIDYNQEHLLLPAEATSGESVTATLTVTFADGTTSTTGPRTINLSENNLEANFSPQDTTVCESCFDLMPLLEVQQGEGGQGGQGPGGPGGPGVGGPGGGNGVYEYFWSNKRDEGWGPEAPNQICEPGLYWVLVREPQSSCYVYASIRVRMWDLDDQSNNIWYFGDGAGIDFNEDPAGILPTPRPVDPRHPQNIPAGTTTISDETGQVLFYTDGSTVWDLNGDVMANGEDIGGSNQASEGVIAVAIPQEETIFYLFTTSTAADGSSQVKFSLVDIKAENQDGVGNVVTKDNFLFSPATQHSAAIAAGDTTWVLFHELGNNTFRSYPITQFGIGPPVFSSVGSVHGFNTGVGSMKFSPDGSKVAVTIQDGACSRVELFDFDQSTGRLTEYASVDLDCNGDDVYGVEFSNDSDRIFVTYTGNGGKVEEFIIQSPSSQDEDDDLSCGACFETATTSAQRAQCILNSRKDLGINGPIGAIQMGPMGDIYIARPGQNFLGTIQPGGLCGPSTGTTEGFQLLPGTTSNLGLPSFVQQSGSSIPEPAISGPDRLCLDPENGAEGLFEGAGEPDIDSYFWTIVHEDGEVIESGLGGPGEENQTLTYIFQREGLHTVTLRVDRCGDPEHYNENNSIEVLVVAPPEITLENDVTLCSGTPVTLTAIDGYDPADGLYDFEWRNAAGIQFGDENSNEITVEEESIYTVTVSYRNTNQDEEFFDACPATRSVFVGPAFEFDLTQTAEEVCYDETLVVFAPDTPVSGEWFFQLDGSPDRVPFSVGEAFELEITPSIDLPGPGLYQIIFVTEDPIVPGCLVEKVLQLEVFPLPNFEIRDETPATDCDSDDGFFEIEILIDLSELEIMETGELFANVPAGKVFEFTDLAPGNYTIRAQTAFGCEFTRTATILNLDPTAELVGVSLDSTDESCGINEILPGTISIELSAPPTGTYSYTITRQGDGEVIPGNLDGQVTLIQDLRFGEYEVQVEDATGCAIPLGEVTIDRRFLVDFSVPSNVVACESFELDILTQQNLVFTVTDPNGNEVIPDSDGIYLLIDSGEYIVYGEGQDPDFCPRERRINLTVNDANYFSLQELAVDCVEGFSYEAILTGTDPADVFFFWRDAAGTVVGRSQTFRPRSAGDYTLDVQPRIGSNCPTPPVAFTVGEFNNEVDYDVDVIPFCNDRTFALIEITGDLSGLTIEWYRVVAGISIIQSESSNQFRAEEEGIYEFVIRNSFDCLVGREQVSIRQSVLVAPELDAEYKICEIENLTPTINPGEYENYEWYLIIGEEETELMSTDATFTPTVAGNYRLIVFDDLGCEEAVDFVVVEDCDIMVRIPNAMRPNAPVGQNSFEVYASEFVDEFSVFIYNRWGELIFFCEENNLQRDRDVSTPFCPWDGTVNGKTVPIGTYPVVVRFRSNNQNITRVLRESILVIE